MALTPGTRLGPYEITAPIGAGGMGEVYKAKDTRLDRTVAIKILPETLAADPQFRERFDREARAVSQLDHPNICALYDVGEQAGTAYLVMQYLEGETLQDRLVKGALPLDYALKTAIEIASALDKAHRAGIVHRDLKPGNIMLTKTGAKLLDFGLAKTSASVVAGAGLSMLPTTPPNLTAQGTILGTFQYMAPEQLEGQEADARTDIFAFGAVVYEMLTGTKAFEGKSQASLIGAIMHAEPASISALQPLTPPALDHVVERCLAKDPDDRRQAAGDVMRELAWVASGAAVTVRIEVPPASARRNELLWLLVAGFLIAFLAVGLIAVRHLRETAPEAEAIEFTLPAPEGAAYAANSVAAGTGVAPQFALSRDGRQIVFLGSQQGRLALWIRPLRSLTARMLPGTEQAAFPFWSPDGCSSP